jgi:preprotein translocase subunit YajC
VPVLVSVVTDNFKSDMVIQIGAVLSVVALAWIFLIRPQIVRLSRHKQFLLSLKVGDQVVTRGGLIGVIAGFGNRGVVEITLSPSSSVIAILDSIEGPFVG